jgi:hypothetical protein
VCPPDSAAVSLNYCTTDEFEKLLDNSDDAWEYELSDVPGIPEIMVCGEPSVGKTSVLEAISQMRLPRGHVTYSRHATK